MSGPLVLLTLMCLSLALVGVFSTSRLMHFPVVAGLIMSAFMVPQAYAIERLHMADAYSPQYSWFYIFACMVAIVLGWSAGRFRSRQVVEGRSREKDAPDYNINRLALCCVGMSLLGGYAYYQMSLLADSGAYSSQWEGVITLYYLLSSLLVMSLALSWLLFLHTRRALFLAIGLVSLLIFLPTLTVMVKRSWIFEIGVIAVGGLYLVRRYRPNKIAVIVAVLFGTVLIHQVGNVRSYVQQNDANAIAAIEAGVLTEDLAIVEMTKAPEMMGAVTRISVARTSGNYEPGVAIWNRLVHQYVPAFIVGGELKEGLKFPSEIDDTARAEYFRAGATSTGFADSFSAFWWFGTLCFAAIAFLFGRFWESALRGDLRSQFLYLVLLNDGLVALTESIARFVATLPFLIGIVFVVCAFAKVRTSKQAFDLGRMPSRARGTAGSQVFGS